MKNILLLVAFFLQIVPLSANADSRIKENFDFDWSFTQGDNAAYAQENYSDTQQWEKVQLPHDWNIKQKFDISAGGSSAFLPGGIGWYRKTFTVPASYKGKKVFILFDGIFNQSDVYINGKHLGFRPYGFCSIEYDLTPYLNLGGNNTLAVRVDCTGERARWYTGSGIYRHAWLQVVQPVHIPTYGTYITTPVVGSQKAEVDIKTTVDNASSSTKSITVLQQILNAAGKVVAKSSKGSASIEQGNQTDVAQTIEINNPQLWSVDTPILYTMVTTVKADGKVVDSYKTPFGVRTIKFDSDKGFFLNGKHLKLKGLCLHESAGCLGSAVPNRSFERELEILKEYGCNAIRCAHNQPTPELLDMCDRMGFVVIDEAFDKWKSGYYEKYFDKWWQKDLSNMILRDRNHPSVILWSIGNELQEAWEQDDAGVERAKMLNDFVHKLEPTHPTVLAAQNNHQTKFAGVTDVIGYNYLEARAISDHKKYPERRMLITEELPYYRGAEGNIRSYSTDNPWNVISANDFFAGGFTWSGVDYLGEASNWPSKGWPNGLFDICMNEKPRAAFLRAMWNEKPVVSIAVMDPSLDIDHGRDLWQWPNMASLWNFPDKYLGLIMEVQTITNCDSVKLYFNDKLMGEQRTADFPNHTVVWHIPYNPGKVVAKGVNDGKEVAEYEIATSKNTSKAIVKADRTQLKADGQDLSYITVQLDDSDGRVVQTDDRKVTVSVEGEGRFMGIDNGDLRRENSFAGNELKTYFGHALAIVQSTRQAGTMQVRIKVDGIDEPYIVNIQSGK